MDLEQLKLILETVETLGGNAQTLFILYMSIQAFKIVLGCGLALTGILLAYKLIKSTVATVSGIYAIQDAMGVNTENFPARERERAVRLIKAGIEAQKNEKTKM